MNLRCSERIPILKSFLSVEKVHTHLTMVCFVPRPIRCEAPLPSLESVVIEVEMASLCGSMHLDSHR